MLKLHLIADVILMLWCCKNGVICGLIAMVILAVKYGIMFNVFIIGIIHIATKDDEDFKDLM